MSMLDPFNPRPGPLPGDEAHGRPVASRGSGLSFAWIPVAIVGGIGVLVVVAAL